MANVTYTVVAGDTLSAIARKYNTTVNAIMALNPIITDANHIVPGQTFVISGTPSTAGTATSNTMVTIGQFGLMSTAGGERGLYVNWSWPEAKKVQTDHYEVVWYYTTGVGERFIGSESNTTNMQSLYTAPSNALRAVVKIRPVSKTYTTGTGSTRKEQVYWTADWAESPVHYFAKDKPETPSAPDVSIDGYKLTVTINNLPSTIKKVRLQIVRNDSAVVDTPELTVSKTAISYEYTITPGYRYKVRCQVITTYGVESDWSDYSGNQDSYHCDSIFLSTPRRLTKNSVYLVWNVVYNATSYEIEYATKEEYFDSSSEVSKTTSLVTHAEITGLEPGEKYFFRVRAVNNQGESDWSKIVSIVLREKTAAPTTWSSTTTAMIGDPLYLYWMHNSEDGSSQTYAQLEVIVNGVKNTYIYNNTTTSEEYKDKTSGYEISTLDYAAGSIILWRVRTAGILAGSSYDDSDFGDWSIQRRIEVYAPPTLTLTVTNSYGNALDILTALPIKITASAGPYMQQAVSYSLSITADRSYETVDNVGNKKFVNAGEEIYNRYFDTSYLNTTISANDVTLENYMSYVITCTVSMNSGLTATSKWGFETLWTSKVYEPEMELIFDTNNYTASINPYCRDLEGNLINGVTLDVYRREYDGNFTEIGTNMPNNGYTFVIDPLPALDYARYRIVAKSTTTGEIGYYDPPGYPVDAHAVIIQWDESWSDFNAYYDDGKPMAEVAEKRPWTGSLLKLPYNIDMTEKTSIDMALVKYIGRAHPVSYYGTQLGVSSSMSMDIPKSDKETIYALRRLMIWPGDVYIREPSGIGYWAHVQVSFGQTHKEVIVPVSIEVTRVEGGM